MIRFDDIGRAWRGNGLMSQSFCSFFYNLFCISASNKGQEAGLIVVGVGVMDLCEERGGTGWKGQFRDERGQGWRFRVENEVRQSRRFGMSGMDAVGWVVVAPLVVVEVC